MSNRKTYSMTAPHSDVISVMQAKMLASHLSMSLNRLTSSSKSAVMTILKSWTKFHFRCKYHTGNLTARGTWESSLKSSKWAIREKSSRNKPIQKSFAVTLYSKLASSLATTKSSKRSALQRLGLRSSSKMDRLSSILEWKKISVKFMGS